MNPVIEFSARHPVAALAIGAISFASLILAGLAISFAANDDQTNDDIDLTYWD